MNGTRSRWSQNGKSKRIEIRLDKYLTRRAVLMDKDRDTSDFRTTIAPALTQRTWSDAVQRAVYEGEKSCRESGDEGNLQ